MLTGLLANLLMGGSQKNPETGQRNWSTGQFWGDISKSLIPGGGGQLANQIQGNQQQMAMFIPRECPDPYGVHGPGIMMNKTSMYGQPMWLCPACAYREPAEG